MKSLGLTGPEQTQFYVKSTKLGAPLILEKDYSIVTLYEQIINQFC